MQKKESITTNESLTGIPFPGDLRDWLAGRAMQSLVGGTGWAEEIEHIAIRSYQMADAMLKQREVK